MWVRLQPDDIDAVDETMWVRLQPDVIDAVDPEDLRS